jgi:hypothetical protein
MGAAYSRLSEESHPESDLQNEDDLAKNQTSSLLCLSTGAFLIASSVINALGQGKVSAGYQETRVLGRVRAYVRILVGVVVALILPHFTRPLDVLGLLVPSIILLLAWWEYWGCAPRPPGAREPL